MHESIVQLVRELTGAQRAVPVEHVQTLWSGYGAIVRCELHGAATDRVIVKHIEPPIADSHPRGWNTDRSRARKLRSYEVEAHWYDAWTSRLDGARVPACLGQCARADGSRVVVLEDLDAAGFAGRRHELDDREFDACLRWLANLHASFVGVVPEGLWPTGTYWHLATRPDELERMPAGPLRDAAPALDAALHGSKFRTIVHGDAKVANFCFADDGDVAAVDFQYVGGGCGVQDVAYFFGSCLTDRELHQRADAALDAYFAHLRAAAPAVDLDELEADGRRLYPIAWADFERFLLGWAPGGHKKLSRYSAGITAQALDSL